MIRQRIALALLVSSLLFLPGCLERHNTGVCLFTQLGTTQWAVKIVAQTKDQCIVLTLQDVKEAASGRLVAPKGQYIPYNMPCDQLYAKQTEHDEIEIQCP